MPRKHTAEPTQIVTGRRSGEPEHSAAQDRRLIPGSVFNDVQSLIGPGDPAVYFLQIRCHCGAPVGAVARYEPTKDRDSSLDVVELQLVTDASARPVVVRPYSRLLGESRYAVDCGVHGRFELDGSALTTMVRKVEAKIFIDGRNKPAKFILSPAAKVPTPPAAGPPADQLTQEEILQALREAGHTIPRVVTGRDSDVQ